MKRLSFPLAVLLLHTLFLAGLLWLRRLRPEFDPVLLIGGNALLAGVTLLSHFLARRPMHGRPEAFVRGVYSGTLLKLFVVAGGILVYLLLEKHRIHKPSLAVLAGIYIAYTAAETAVLQGLARGPKR